MFYIVRTVRKAPRKYPGNNLAMISPARNDRRDLAVMSTNAISPTAGPPRAHTLRRKLQEVFGRSPGNQANDAKSFAPSGERCTSSVAAGHRYPSKRPAFAEIAPVLMDKCHGKAYTRRFGSLHWLQFNLVAVRLWLDCRGLPDAPCLWRQRSTALNRSTRPKTTNWTNSPSPSVTYTTRS